MNMATERIGGNIRPELKRREAGGWLAISPKWARFLIGVVGETQEDAEEKFQLEFSRWVSIVDDTIHEST
jgi:hypothetical protein